MLQFSPRFQLVGASQAIPEGVWIFEANIVMVPSFVPETKDLSLEQLDARFGISSKRHAKFAIEQCMYIFRRYGRGRKSTKPSPHAPVDLLPLTRKNSV